MHPNAAFRFKPEDPALAFVAAYGFAHLFGSTPDGPRVAHVPLLVTAAGTIRFHLANGNALVPHLPGSTVLASVGGPGSYVSPNWYAEPANHVPTWNYRSVEVQGSVRALDADELEALLNLSAATFEPRVGQNWSMAKMERPRAEAMMRAITGFELTPETIRSTDKASQNRSDADARGVVTAMKALGDTQGAAAIRRTREW